MSHSNLTLSILGIPDTNINVTDVRDESRGTGARHRKYHVIFATLSYTLKRCPLCGFEALRPNGHKLTHIHVKGATEIPTVLDLRKQRWLCANCHRSTIATTPLVQFNCSIAKGIQDSVLKLSIKSLPVKTIAAINGISSSSVQRILTANVKYRPARKLPENLCFDEFRSTGNMMSFICIDGDSHSLVSLLGDRLNKTIKDFFISHYSLKERSSVRTITMDMNAAYQLFVHEVFPKAQIIIDRFHIVQLLGRALDQARIAALKQIHDHHLRTYKVLKSQWRLFHKADPDASHIRYLFGLNEYTTEQNALDLALDENPALKLVYEAYLAFHSALMNQDTRRIWHLLDTYRATGTPLDVVMETLRKNRSGVLAATASPRSNGPIEGINRLIKSLKRSCFGFRNQANFFDRIYQLTA
jgi:transposase